jgi:hypothetical protein
MAKPQTGQIRPGSLVVPNPLPFETFVWLYPLKGSHGDVFQWHVRCFGTGLVVANPADRWGETVTVMLGERLWLVDAARVKIVDE